MRDNCPECARLWEAYLAARKEHAEAWRAVEGGGKEAVERARAAFSARENVREKLSRHQEEVHK